MTANKAIASPGMRGLLHGKLVLYMSSSLEADTYYRTWVDLLGGAVIVVSGQVQLMRWLRFYNAATQLQQQIG